MDSRNEQALLEQLDAWEREGKYRAMAEAVLYLPPQDRNSAFTARLAAAYAGLGEWQKAIRTLEGLFPEQGEDADFQCRLAEAWRGFALSGQAEDRDDALENAWFCAERALMIGGSRRAEELAAGIEADYGRPFAEVYTQEEREAAEAHIAAYFGPIETVWREAISIGVRLDLAVIPPHDDKDYYTVVTVGLGAHRMDVPPELAEYRLERAELAIAVPGDWKINDDGDEWYWPIRQLKSTARVGVRKGAWLGWGHTIDCGGPLAADTDLSGMLLIMPQQVEEEGFVCRRPGGEEINFYQLIPLYPEEIAYKQNHGAEKLLDAMEHVSFVVDPHRWHPLQHRMAYDAAREDILDEADWRVRAIREKHLAVGDIAAYSHQAVYLRWCIEKSLMSGDFEKTYAAVTETVRQSPEKAALREFIRDKLGGVLRRSCFNQEGQDFSRYYYEWGRAPYYPSDIDDYALAYFGGEDYRSKRFDDEAYLFLPYDETYYREMKAVIDRRWAAWQKIRDGQRGDLPEGSGTGPEISWEKMTCLAAKETAAGAPVRFIRRERPHGKDSGWRLFTGVSRGYGSRDWGVEMTMAEALELCPELVEILGAPAGSYLALGEDGHFRPGPYVPPEDESAPPDFAETFMALLGCRTQYFPPMADSDRLTAAWGYARRIGVEEGTFPVFIEADEALLTHIRGAWEAAGGREACTASLLAAKRPRPEALFPKRSFFSRLFGGSGKSGGGRAVNGWPCLFRDGATKPVIFARIPAEKAEEIFASFPYGGWRGAPDTASLMAAAARWSETCGAVPAALTADGLTFRLPAPAAKEKALRTAEELAAFCPALLNGQTIGALADSLIKSRTWELSWKK